MFWILIWILLALWGCTYVEEGAEEKEPLRLTFLDVGQGLAVLLEQGGKYALYDAGPDSAGIADTLEARGIRELDWVMLSHNHRDHVGGFVELAVGLLAGGATTAAKVCIGRLYVGPDTAGGVWRDSVLYVALRQGIPVDTLVRGDMLGFGGGANGSAVDDELPELRVLWPPDYETVSENHGSVVLQVSWGASSVLLTGDLDSLGERKLLELSPTLSAGLLQVPHHGSAGSSSLAFLAQVSPEYAVVSVGDGNPYGHPAQAVSQKLKYVLGDSLRFFRTDLQGSVSFELSRDFGAIPLTVPKR